MGISYDWMVETALRGVVREALVLAAGEGLPRGHHFYIAFRTTHPLTVLPLHLKAQHPEEMTIVLQHQFWNLTLAPQWFEIDLSFQGKIETLRVPFEAIISFADPFAKFMLQFQPPSAGGEREEEDGGSGDGGERIFDALTGDATEEDGGSGDGGERIFDALTGDATEEDSGPGDGDESDLGGGRGPSDGKPKPGNVVALDRFRKK